MATLKNTTVAGNSSITNVRGSAAQATTGANGGLQNGAFRYDTDVNETLYSQSTTLVNPIPRASLPDAYNRPRNLAGDYPGISSSNPATSAQEILKYNPSAGDGVYWINLPSVGARQVYCVMNAAWAGGGWMMAMKATRGGTFTFGSSYWTSVNTLNDNASYWNLNDQDAKFEVFNRFPAKDIMARFPDLGNGGSLNIGNWTWYQPNFYNGQTRGSTYSGQVNGGGAGGAGQGPQRGHRIELVNLFNRVNRYFIQDADTFHGGPAYGNFSSQVDIRFYGFNWNDNLNSRWGFGYNENGGGVYPYGAEGSDDVVGGIGTNYHSAGDQINCCQNRTGANRSMRVEIYVR
jgi:hypothetical protein